MGTFAAIVGFGPAPVVALMVAIGCVAGWGIDAILTGLAAASPWRVCAGAVAVVPAAALLGALL